MDIKKELKDFKKKIDPEIEKFLEAEIKELVKKDKFVTGILEHAKKITMSGGKRLRPALMCQGFIAAGGNKNDERILKAAVSVELLHFFLLIHDDIIDRDEKRHGVVTTHEKYFQIGKMLQKNKNSRHFGNSIAIIAGDMLHALGNISLYKSGFDADVILKSLENLQNVVAMTIVGESQDVVIEFKGKATEKEVLDVYVNKTAKYTVEGPLQTGAILAGADEKILNDLSKISIPLGVAFQIQDDILGIFGKEEKIGKPVGSDIEEGKQTILVVKALENASSKQKKSINNILGKKGLSEDEILEFKNAILETGSLKYAKDLALRYIEEGKKEIEKSNINSETKEFLIGIADYMASREI
ncbi:MAG: polyprenyl synthetase family protein [Candidatus Moranbacteria bacterium]|nr:polyprenyl synthetase family protein [Candidatus Moranbacteria bacterium]